ncbi:MAG: tetratricopeptide repeat protein [SAR324 cluster bacterium]|nr:tetratricopeptide repeat protein [SAR324 cluster bacterium]
MTGFRIPDPNSILLHRVFWPAHPIAKNMLIQLLRKLLSLLFISLFFSGLASHPSLQGRPLVGVLSVDIHYPSRGLNWLEIFLQEELSLQLQLADRFSIISPESMRRWNQRLKNSDWSESNSSGLNNSEISQLKPDKILKLSIQKVLNQLSVTWNIHSFRENESLKIIKNIHSWITPDKLINSLLNDIIKEDKFFRDLRYFPLNYTWEGIRSFYQWRLKSVPKINSSAWIEHKDELEALIFSYPSLEAKVRFYRSILLIIKSSVMDPAHVPSLNLAEKDILASMEIHPGNGAHHSLLALLHYLRKEPLFAKQQANIAHKINPRDGLALIIYGLTIGKTPQAGSSYIREGLRLYPFVAEPSSDNWQPYHALVKDLEPWLNTSISHNKTNYDQLMSFGNENYNAQRWSEARQAFKDASVLEPSLPEPLLSLAKLELAQHNTQNALSLLSKIRQKFPRHADTKLYTGYAHEKLKHYNKAESFYREVLNLKPEHHKALLRLGAVLIKLGKRGEARSFLESLTQKYPMYTVAWWNLGIIYYQLGELELAESAWEESLRLEPDNNQVRVRLAQLREELF